MRFGNSSQVRRGHPLVLALGNAEGHGGATPAQGIINALDRSIQASDEGSNSTENLNHMLQTNARIQQGDSGGALANNAGQVIGMITAANTGSSSQSTSGGTLGFAIPINTALAIARQIASRQPSATVHIGLPGFLGVEVATSDSSNPQQQAADEAQTGRNGRTGPGANACSTSSQPSGVPAHIAPVAAGALIVGVLCNSAAQSAGMVPGDVITSVSRQPITTPGSLTTITGTFHPGDVVSVLWVSRDGIEHTTQMMLGARARPGPGARTVEPVPQAGLALGDLADLHVLAGRVRDLRDARPVVHRRDAEGGEPGHVGPAELGPRRPADRRGELGRGRLAEARPGAVRDVEHRHRPRGEHRLDVIRRLLPAEVRREPVVDRDRALVGDDVARHAAPDADRVQALVVAQAVDLRLPGRVRAQHVQDGAGLVDGVAAHPGARGVRPLARHHDLGAQRALAAAFDLGQLGSISTAKSPARSSGLLRLSRSSPLRSAATSSQS